MLVILVSSLNFMQVVYVSKCLKCNGVTVRCLGFV